MAVFVSASDESDGGHHRSRFWHAGFIAPESDWFTYFAPAWQERVLDAPPPIEYLHMTDIRDPKWRKENNISWLQAQDKMDQATLLIDQMGSLYPIATYISGATFLDAFGKKKVIEGVGGKKPMRFLVDHFSFNAYVFIVLLYVHARHPEAEKVDFIVERKEGVWEKLKEFYDTLPESLRMLGHEELAPLLGEIFPAGKKRVPVQAADMLCWHASRADLEMLKGRDAERAAVLFSRKGKVIPVEDEIVHALARAFEEKFNEQEQRIPEVRRDNAKTDQRSARQAKSRSRRGETGKKKKVED